jgi:hypothetical protein
VPLWHDGRVGRRVAVIGLGLLVGLLGMGGAACGGDDDGASVERDETEESEESGDGASSDVEEPELRDELLGMMDADQEERTGAVGTNHDSERTERLGEIIDEHGWPTFDLVGREAATAAWVIAQHSDQDVPFQEQALELMQAAVDDDQADASELAYLADRVAVNNGEPQRYGTQVRCAPGGAQPATPLVDADRVDELRADIGLDPLATYLAEFEEGCAEELGAP